MPHKEANYYIKLEKYNVLCQLCPNLCKIAPGTRGRCKGRINVEGDLIAENYGRITALALDPIEKKPLYHFHPLRPILSVGTYGCNFECGYCQNWQIAQGVHSNANYISPDELVEKAKKIKGNIGITFTYNEPNVWFEYVMETCKLNKKSSLKNVLVTNGYIMEEPLRELIPLVDGMNIDVKGFTGGFYKKNCKGLLDIVYKTVELCFKAGIHIEITSLIIPGENDEISHFKNFVNWLSSLDRRIPLHLSRYFPNYNFTKQPTSIETLIGFREMAKKFLDYVFIGNVPSIDNNTYCPICKELIVDRLRGKIYLKNSQCPSCQNNTDIIV